MKKKTLKKDNTKLVNGIILFGIILLLISFIIMLKNNKKIDNHIIEIDYNRYSELINRDEYSIILLTSLTCTHCNSYKPYVNYVCDDYKLSVYDLDINKLGYDEYIEIHDKYTITKDSYINGNPSISTPTTIITKNGEEIDSISGNLGYSGFLDLLIKNEIIKK